ncbi:hypothetical protein KHQ82_04790 [Mycoplasmatota bacterium]|nr:hypothetical protein KHQ82_04790 [Mycoplasmatota bacterium]
MNKNNRYHSIVIFIVPALRTTLFIAAGILLGNLPPFRGRNLRDASSWWGLLCVVVNIITIIILLILTKRDGKTFKDLINHNPDKKKTLKEIKIAIPMMLLLGIGGLWGFSYLVYGYMPVTNTQPLPIWAAILVLILLPITIVFAEIPLYLGYCAPGIKNITKNEVLSIAYPLFFYALQHSFIPLLFDYKHILSRFLVFIPLLAIIGIWYYKKKDLLPLMIGHGLLDTLTVIQILLVSIYPSIYEMMRSASVG